MPVTLITGASRGIGNFLARHYLDKNHYVYGCSRGESSIEHPRYRHFALDITDEKRVAELFMDIRERHNALDHLINNAGVASMNLAILTPLETVRKIFETNFMGTYLFCREAAKLMQPKRFGRIVNFSTIAVPLRLKGESAYSSSKVAVLQLTQTLAAELGPLGITVNAIGPGPVATDLIRGVPQETIQKLMERLPISEWNQYEDISNVVDFFLEPRSRLVSGQCLYLGGVS